MEPVDSHAILGTFIVAVAEAALELDQRLPEGAVPQSQELASLLKLHIEGKCQDDPTLTHFQKGMLHEAAKQFEQVLNNPDLKRLWS